MLIEDEEIVAKDIENILQNYGYKYILTFNKAEDAIENIMHFCPDLILMDVVLKGQIDGIEAAKKINTEYQIPIIFLTAYADEITINRIIETIPYGYFLKPFEEKELVTWIQTTLTRFKVDKELKDKLTKAERDLKQIEYIASHDLQEPLRMIASYVKLLEKKYSKKIDSDADEFINYTVDGVNRMKDMINDLLEFSRINIHNFKPENLDLNDLVEQTTLKLRKEFDSRLFEVSYHNLPLIVGDKKHFLTLFYCFLSNALKFNESQNCIININCSQINKELLFSISDNGIGIDNKYSDKVFDIFQKLHDTKTYPGTGMGLALCRKIIEFYNGELWFDSKQSQGTTFKFTIKINGGYSIN